MITDEKLSDALGFLSESDEKAAELHTQAERMDYRSKMIRDEVFLHSEGTVAERTARAGCSPEYRSAVVDYLSALEESKAIQNKRNTASLIVDIWRTEQANRRQGQIQ